MKSFVWLLCGCLFLTGCSSLSTHSDATGLKSVKRVYVEHLLTDNDRIDECIVGELKARGYDAACGPLTMMPDNVDAIVTYSSRTAWDFKSYVIELNVAVNANFTNKPLATGRYYQPSLRTKSAPEVVHDVIGAIFPAR